MSLPAALRHQYLAGLWSAVHRRLGSGRPVSRVSVPLPSAEERHAVADLLGLAHQPSDPYSVSLAGLDAILVEIAGRDTRSVVSELVGPLDDRAGRAAAERAARAELWSWARTHPVVVAQPALLDWLAGLRVEGSVERTRVAVAAALDVLAALPTTGRPLPAFAQDVLGDEHALDDGRRLSTLVLRGLAVVHGVPAPTAAADRHRLWESAGVTGDQLSVSVLAAGLRSPVDAEPSVVHDLLATCVRAGHAASLTLAQLRSVPMVRAASDVVWVVENPTVLALALDAFGTGCPPLICTSGWPNGAATLLIRHLIASGATVYHHGDLDGEGVRIVAHLAATIGTVPWRMTADDYLHAVVPGGRPAGRVTDAPWDDALAPAMRRHDVAVSEEQVAATLLDEMQRTAQVTSRRPPTETASAIPAAVQASSTS